MEHEIEMDTEDVQEIVVYDFEEKKLDEKDIVKKLNQSKLNKHEMDELFLFE